ncbi:MAG: DUF350 domain-containing protein [Magnetococcales bacterium]|nr:DUF350 domain-containing protein [Magnetococcales bacterium]
MTTLLTHAAQGVGLAIACGFFMWLAKFFSDHAASKRFDSDHEIEENSNLAVGLRRGGLYGAIAIGMYGSVSSGISQGFMADLTVLALDGILIVLFTMLCGTLNDKVIIDGIDNDQAVLEGNIAVGLTEAGGYLATGLIMYGAVSGEGGPWWGSMVWFVLGQLALLTMIYLYEWMTPFNVVENIRQGRAASGLMLGGMMVAMGFILKGAISGVSNGWSADLQAFGLSFINSLFLLLVVFHQFVDRIFLPGTTIQTEIERDNNTAAILVVITVKIALALFISAVVL